MTHGNSDSDPRATPAPDWEAIARYLAGESPAGEAESVREWLASHAADAELLAALDRIADRLAFKPAPDLDVEGALQRVKALRAEPAVLPFDPSRRAQRIQRSASTRAGGSTSRTTVRWRVALPAAAAAVVVAVGGLLWQAARRSGHPAGSVAQMYATAVGQRDSVRLADGSRVLLGPRSQLTVAAGFGDKQREVELKGEGFFDVRHDAAHPFVVRAGAATIRDIGTTFTVHSDANEEGAVRVAVTSGAVALQASGAPDTSAVVLHARDRAALQADGRAVVQRAAATDDDLAWTRGRLIFREAPLAQVSADLRRWYGIELRVADSSLASKHLTADFAGDSKDHVLDVIALSLGAKIDRTGDTVVLRASPRSARPR